MTQRKATHTSINYFCLTYNLSNHCWKAGTTHASNSMWVSTTRMLSIIKNSMKQEPMFWPEIYIIEIIIHVSSNEILIPKTWKTPFFTRRKYKIFLARFQTFVLSHYEFQLLTASLLKKLRTKESIPRINSGWNRTAMFNFYVT